MRTRRALLAVLAAMWLVTGCETTATTGDDVGVACPDVVTTTPDRVGAGDCPTLLCPAPDCGSEPEDPVDVCAAWTQFEAAENLRSLRRFGLHSAAAVIEGQFGTIESIGERDYALFTVETVHAGWRFLEGSEVLVPLPDVLPDEPVAGARWVLGLSNAHPSAWEPGDRPYWGNLVTMVPAAERADYTEAMAYHAEEASGVAVVRIVAQDEFRTSFEVIDTLKGTWPANFADNWREDWGLPYPDVSNDLWIATVQSLTAYPEDEDGTVHIGSVLDFRPATEDALADARQAIGAPPLDYDAEKFRAEAAELVESFRFFTAEAAVSSVVTGFAGECCTGAGGTFVQHEVVHALSGDAVAGARFVTGGHAYYGEETCGDRFLFALRALVDPVAMGDEDFACREYPGSSAWPAEQVGILSSVDSRRVWSNADEARVRGWLAAAPPLYAVRNDNRDPEEAPPAQDRTNAPWSLPLDPVAAFLAATHIAIITVEEVTPAEAWSGHDVRFVTTWSRYEYEHLPRRHARLAFRCGDARLLEVGSRWVAGFVMLEDGYDESWDVILGRGFLVPGALVPEWAFPSAMENALSFLASP